MRLHYISGSQQKWSNWKNEEDCSDDELQKANLRELYDDETVLDSESQEHAKKVRDQLVTDKVSFEMWNTGSKGVHFHFRVDKLQSLREEDRKQYREALIKKYRCDWRKKTGVIAKEDRPHFKTGNKKTLVEKQDFGINYLNLELFNKIKKVNIEKKQSYDGDDVVKKIKDSIKISDLIKDSGGKIRTKTTALCPLHPEKNPSFSFDDDKGLWFCFHNYSGGDAFTLVQEKNSCDFVEAKHKLMKMAGIEPVITVTDKPKEKRIKVKFVTDHLPFFNEIRKCSMLQGSEYIPFIKGIYYTLLGTALRDKKIVLGSLKADTRTSLMVVLPSGQGKNNLKNTIKKVMDECGYDVDIPMTTHSQQLIGKVVNRGTIKKPSHEKINGYLSRDYLIFDESYDLFTSKDEDISQSRRAIRVSQDPIGDNPIEKKQVDHAFSDDEKIKYYSNTTLTCFLQPKYFPETIIEDGDLRRFLVLYRRGISERDKTEDYENRLLTTVSQESHVKNFSRFIFSIKHKLINKDFNFPRETVDRLLELHSYLLNQTQEHSVKGSNYGRIIDFTLQNMLVKLSCVMAATVGSSTVSRDDVDLAFVDLTEFLQMGLDFVDDKVRGNLDYGDAWNGAKGTDQSCLEWLHQQKENVSIASFKAVICDQKGVKIDQASKHFARFKQKGWIVAKQVGQYDSSVKLGFTPKLQGGKGGKGCNPYKTIISDILTKKAYIRSVLPLHPLHPSTNSDTIPSKKLEMDFNKKGQAEFRRSLE